MMIACAFVLASLAAAAKPAAGESELRPTIGIAPLVAAGGAETWVGLALADELTNRLLIHSRYEPKSLQRLYPLNVFGWRQVASAARGEGIDVAAVMPSKARDKLLEQLGADALLMGTYEVTGKKVAIEWMLHGGGKTEPQRLSTSLDDLSRAAELIAPQVLVAIGQPPEGLLGHKHAPLPLAAVRPFGQALEILARQSLDPRASLVLTTEELTRAIALLSSTTDAAPTFSRGWIERGIANAMLGRHTEAEDAFVQAMAQAGEFEPANSLGIYYLYDRQQKTHEAIERLEEATKAHLGFLQGLGYLGEAYARANMPHEALQTFTTYAQRVPKSPWAQARRAAALSRLGKHDLAVGEARATLKRLPGSFMLQIALASRQIDAADYDGARATIALAAKARPDHPALLTRLSYIALAQDKPEEALALAEKAVAALGDGRGEQLAGYAHLNLAHALALTGKSKEAFAAVKRAQELGVGADELRNLTRDVRLKAFLGDPRCPIKVSVH